MTESKDNLINRAGEIYTSAYPIEVANFFSGRRQELYKAYQVIPQKGMHLIVFGDRGVGKTSFANVLKNRFEGSVSQVVKLSCSTEDTFDSIWKQIFRKLFVVHTESINVIGFAAKPVVEETAVALAELIPKEKITVETILRFLAPTKDVIVIIDELDRLQDRKFNKKLFTDALKAISDNIPTITFIMVGIADDVSTLIKGHQSIERNLRQIYMPTMDPDEIRELVIKGQSELKIKFTPETIAKIVMISDGYPHYAHSLCYHAVTLCIYEEAEYVLDIHLNLAIARTIEYSHESLRNAYRQAIANESRSLFSHVLRAASIVETDKYGYFQAKDLEKILSDELGKKMKVNNFINQMRRLCLKDRGEIFKTVEAKNRRKYKFKNPLMRAFVRLNS
jgi:Cdc6-like AAA superfamily ATPase